MEANFLVFGEPASKANSRIVAVVRGRVMNIKGAKAQNYKKMFLSQCPTMHPLIEGDVTVTIHVYYASRRSDLDVSLILDLMQGRIYHNDRQVKEQHLFWGLDKENPRAEISVQPRAEGAPPAKAPGKSSKGKDSAARERAYSNHQGRSARHARSAK